MVYRRRVVEDRSPMGPIIAVIATILILFLAWLLLFRDGFGDDAGDNVVETPATEQEQEEPADTDINVNIPGGETTGGDDQTGAGDEGGDQPEGAGNDGGT